MLIKYNETTEEINRNQVAFNYIFTRVNQLIETEDVVFSHLVVDGEEVYENHETYINTKLNEIMQIEIIMLTKQEMFNSILQNINEYLDRAIPAIAQLVSNSFDVFTKDTWDGITQLTEGMEWMLQFFNLIRQEEVKPANWTAMDESFKHCEAQFALLLEATENEDTLHMSDVLLYEIVPAFEELNQQIIYSLEHQLKH